MRPRARPSIAAVGLPVVLFVFLGACGKPAPVAHLEVRPESLKLGYPDYRELHLSWEPTAALDPEAGPPTIFVHLLDRHGKIVRTYDHPFPEPWQEGTPVTGTVRIFQSALAPPLPAGQYQLTLGLYGTRSGKRWPLDVAARDLGRQEYPVVNVEVPPPAKGPRLGFAGKWLASEPSGSRQIVALRWLDGPGALRVQGLPGPGSLWLEIQIPAGTGAAEKLVFDGPSNSPSVIVSGTCGNGVETGISGSGVHEIDIPTDGAAADGSCEVRLRPNFHLLKAGLPHGGPRSVALQKVAWSPVAPPSDDIPAVPAVPAAPATTPPPTAPAPGS
jgi:hypothetical protein